MLLPVQAAHVLALYLAPRPLNAEELHWLTGECARPDDTAWNALERRHVAERLPGDAPRWRAGPSAGAFVRARLFADIWPPEHRACALRSLLRDGAGPRECVEILRDAWTRSRADAELAPLLEVLVAFLMRWCARRGADPAALDGDFLNLLFALQSFPLSSLSLLRKILRLTARAHRMARNSGNERFTAMLLLSRFYLHVFVGNNSSRLADRLESALNTARGFLGPEDDSLLPLFEGQLAYMRGELKKIIACFNRCSDDMAWCYRRFYDTLGVCALFSAGYLHQFHFALGSVEHFQRKAVLAGDELTAAMFRSNSCFLLLRKGDRKRMRAVLRGLEATPLYEEHAIVHSHVTRAHALLFFVEGDARGAHALLDAQTRRLLARGGKPVTFKDPLVLDMLYVFSCHGFPAVPGYDAASLVQSFLQGANRHLKATALRIRALQELEAGAPPREAVALLRQSFEICRSLGDPQSLALTVHALAQACERDGDAGEARLLSGMVREATGRDLRGVSYHEACRTCMEVRPAAFELFGAALPEENVADKSVAERCHAIFSGLAMPDTREEALHLFVRAAMDVFRQERGGLFHPGDGGEPRFAHIVNVSDLELRSLGMRPCLNWLAAAARESRRPVLWHERHGLVLRLAGTGAEVWLLWLDSVYAPQAFSEIPAEDLLQGARLLAAELRAILRLESFRKREITLRHDKLRDIFLREDRNDCLVLREGLQDLLAQVAGAAVTDVPILICGETGVGKEIMARHIHAASGRSGPFIPVHPAGMVENLFESEFFGHERGAFTGAIKQKIGLFEMADQGTLFIDEIGEMSPLVQTKLLRVLQERRFMRVGGTRELHSRFRLIAATNRDLWQEVRERRFRQDLFYRIAAFPLTMPPLRQRRQDILPLANAFIRHFARRYGKTVAPLREDQAGELLAYDWPGNIRELRSLVERAVILHRGGDLPLLFGLSGDPGFVGIRGKESGDADPVLPEGPFRPESLPTLEEAEARYLRRVMRLTGGRVRGEDGAAALLRMKIPTLYAKLRRHGIACGRG